MSDDDCRSVTSASSTASASLKKLGCPYCNKDFQARSMFNHIRIKHPREFLKSTSKKWIQEAEQGLPLTLWWEGQNDRGDPEAYKIYACLSTNKSFLHIDRALAHFKKDKAALKDHNKQLKQLRKDFEKEEKRKNDEVKNDPYHIALRQNDPELARCFWSSILMEMKICKYLYDTTLYKNYKDESPMYRIINPRHPICFSNFDEVRYVDFIENHYHRLLSDIEDAMLDHSLDCDLLNKLNKRMRTMRYEFVESIRDCDIGNGRDLSAMFPEFTFDEDHFGVCGPDMPKVNF